jgi:hypothetical protein
MVTWLRGEEQFRVFLVSALGDESFLLWPLYLNRKSSKHPWRLGGFQRSFSTNFTF